MIHKDIALILKGKEIREQIQAKYKTGKYGKELTEIFKDMVTEIKKKKKISR